MRFLLLLYLLPHETIVSSDVKPELREASLDTSVKLLFHSRNGHAPPPAGGPRAQPLEPPRARVAPIAIARGGAAQALRLPAARYAGAVRGLPVARPGDPARGGRRDADPDPADRERRPGRRAPPVLRAPRSRLSAARSALSQGPQEARAEVGGE